MKKVWKDEEAVSPVIGVILMVAITVVLAAVLYVWASSFVQSGNNTPKCEFTMANPNNDYAATVQGISEKTDINETSWVIEDSAGQAIMTGEVWHIYDDLYLVGRKDIQLSDPVAYNKSKGGYMRDNDGNPLTDPVDYWENYAGHNITEPTIVFINNDQAGEKGVWKISDGDQFFIRGELNGSTIVKEGYRLKIKYDPTDEIIGAVTLVS